ncbi:MAG: glucan biosynthesis protein [Verrucomicrobiales bacterium]|nr:glucan biosynthesis protein [Verrucomicrobiales bacterium]|tara:strand:- start:465 stop:2177 length:1713 start_codon:yes stop_codon:yes gene_type:complete
MSEESPAGVTPPTLPTARRHDLDALRAVAMLLGIVLHGALAFIPGIWPIQDIHQNEAYTLPIAAIHGFRMPLFFIISGFFTAMLWRRRGLKALITHRFKRIFLPLMLCMVTIIPVTWFVMLSAGQPDRPETKESKVTQNLPDVWTAARTGNLDAIQTYADEGGDLNAGDSSFGSTPLSIAALYGQKEATEALLEAGAEVNAQNKDGGTALHAAAFLGEAEIVKLLLESGADYKLKNQRGETAVNSLQAPWGITQWIAGMLQLKLDKEEVMEGRKQSARILEEYGADIGRRGESEKRDSEIAGAIIVGLFVFPVFHHLWFLWFLCWLVGLFAVYMWIMDKMGWKNTPNRPIATPLRYLWLIPLTMIPQSMMGKMMPVFGPDTSIGLIPMPQVLLFYAIFFGFGVLYFDCGDKEGRLGKYWWVTIPFSLLVLFPIGYELTIGGLGFENRIPGKEWHRAIAVFVQALFSWLMCFGCMGLFHRIFKRERPAYRYISDSSYWLYIAHLPLMIWLHGLVQNWDLPLELKFLIVCAITTGSLLLTYQLFIRYTWVGRLLNGPRTRPQKDGNPHKQPA